MKKITTETGQKLTIIDKVNIFNKDNKVSEDYYLCIESENNNRVRFIHPRNIKYIDNN